MRALRLALFFIVGLTLGGAATWASASKIVWNGAGSVMLKYASDGTPVFVASRSVLDSVADGSGGVTAKATQQMRIGGAGANLNLTKPISVSNVAKAGRFAARALGPIAVAALAYDAYNLVFDEDENEWQTGTPGTPDSVTSYPATLKHPSYTHNFYTNPARTADGAATADQACSNIGVRKFYLQPGSWSAAPASVGGTWPSGSCKNSNGTIVVESWYGYSGCPYGGTADNNAICQAPPSCATGYYRAANGQCLQAVAGSYQRADDSDIEAALEQALTQNPAVAPSILDKGVDVGFIPSPGPLEVTGPASVPGPTTTASTSGPAGQTTTTTGTTHNLTYNGDTVTVTSNTSSTTIHPDNTTTTTETSTSPDGEGVTPEEKQQQLCEEFPDASACQELGETEPSELEEQDVDLDFDPEDFGMAGSCPADKPFSHAGMSFALSWGPVCTFAEGIRPMVIAMAFFGAGLFVFAAARGMK